MPSPASNSCIQKIRERITHARCGGNASIAAPFCEGFNPEYDFIFIGANFSWRSYTRFHFRWVREFVRFADVRTFCVPTAAASSSGRSCFRCFCGHSVAANAAPGTWVFSFAPGESRIRKSLPPKIWTRLDSGLDQRGREFAALDRSVTLSARMCFIVNFEQLADRCMRVTLRGGK